MSIGCDLAVGVVGFGEHARRSHVAYLRRMVGVVVTAICDPDISVDELDAAGTAPVVYLSLDELLDEADVDALVVCSPDRFHAEALTKGVAAGKHVLVDKPLADRAEQLPLVIEALARAERDRLVVTSCHPRRFDPPFRWLRERLPELAERLGPPLGVDLDFYYHRPSKVGLHHGLLIDHVSHEIDLVHFLFGHSPFSAHRLVDDQVRYAVAGIREDGLCFSFSGSRHLERAGYPEAVRVRFERGEVRIDTETGMATESNLDARTTTIECCGATDYERRFRAVNENFVAATLGTAPPYLSVADLLVNTEIGIVLHETGNYDSRQSSHCAALGLG